MKKKYLLPIIAIGITVCMGLTACSSDNKSTANDTSVSNENNTEVNDEDLSEKNDLDTKDSENKLSVKDTNNSEDNKTNVSNNSNSENNSTNSKNSKISNTDTASSRTENNSVSNEVNGSDTESSKASENKTLSKTEAVNKILAKEFSGQSVPKYQIPVTAASDGYSTLKKSEGSNAFLCNDDNNLDNGILVELVNFNGENDSNSFAIRDYNAMKNGGRGMVDKGSISKSGEVTLG